MQISDQAVAEFSGDGFTAIADVFTAEEIGRFRKAAQQIIERDGNSNDEVGLTVTTDAWEKDDTLRELALHPRLGAIAESLAGMPLRIWGGEILVKKPHEGTPTVLHDDRGTSLLDSRITFNAWIPLIDVPVERGCLTFLPGSHRRPGPDRAELATVKEHFNSYMLDLWPDLAWSRRVTVPLRAGGATFHQDRTAHQAGANGSDETRLVFVVTFTDAAATYHPLPDADPLPLQAGQPIAGERYPLAVSPS